MVKALREKSGAGMMDCKKALGESGGDVDAAAELLRKKGLAQAGKKAGRTASDGAIGAYIHLGSQCVVAAHMLCRCNWPSVPQMPQGTSYDASICGMYCLSNAFGLDLNQITPGYAYNMHSSLQAGCAGGGELRDRLRGAWRHLQGACERPGHAGRFPWSG